MAPSRHFRLRTAVRVVDPVRRPKVDEDAAEDTPRLGGDELVAARPRSFVQRSSVSDRLIGGDDDVKSPGHLGRQGVEEADAHVLIQLRQLCEAAGSPWLPNLCWAEVELRRQVRERRRRRVIERHALDTHEDDVFGCERRGVGLSDQVARNSGHRSQGSRLTDLNANASQPHDEDVTLLHASLRCVAHDEQLQGGSKEGEIRDARTTPPSRGRGAGYLAHLPRVEFIVDVRRSGHLDGECTQHSVRLEGWPFGTGLPPPLFPLPARVCE